MTEVFVAHVTEPVDNYSNLVGVYSSFDAAVEGCDAHKAWFKLSWDYVITPQLVDYNNTGDCLRYNSFLLEPGKVPPYLLRNSQLKERFTE